MTRFQQWRNFSLPLSKPSTLRRLQHNIGSAFRLINRTLLLLKGPLYDRMVFAQMVSLYSQQWGFQGEI
jgi:hypothetical protein